jgi:hypothetical protein
MKIRKSRMNKSKSKNMNEFIKGIRFHEDTYMQNHTSPNPLSIHFSTLEKHSQIFKSGNHSILESESNFCQIYVN